MMPKYGVQLNSNVILLIIIATFLPRIFSLDDRNLQNQKYDYIDMAKKTAGSRNKGMTTRIFTANDELDEKFWLKYLGEDFHNVVHLHVDGETHFIPSVDVKPPHLPNLKYNPNADRRTRFVRQPAQQETNKQLPVENLDKLNVNENQHPTESPDTWHTTATTTALAPANKTNYSHNTLQHDNSKPLSKHNVKSVQRYKFNKKKFDKLKPHMIQKSMYNKPILPLHLPEADISMRHIDEKHVPVIVQVPLEIYNPKAELYPEPKTTYRHFVMHRNPLFPEHVPNLNLNNLNMDFFSQPWLRSAQYFYPQLGSGYSTHSLQRHFTTLHNTRPQTTITTTPSYTHTEQNT